MHHLKLPWKWLLAQGRGAHVAMSSVPFCSRTRMYGRAHAYNITPPIWGSLWSHLDCRHSWKPLRSRPCACAGAPTRWVKATCFYVKREIFWFMFWLLLHLRIKRSDVPPLAPPHGCHHFISLRLLLRRRISKFEKEKKRYHALKCQWPERWKAGGTF